MTQQSQPHRLKELLLDRLDGTTAQGLFDQLAGAQCQSSVLEFLDELEEISSKVQACSMTLVTIKILK